MESIVRFAVFVTVLLLMLIWEKKIPFRRFAIPKFRRFAINICMMGFNFIVLRLLSGGGAYMAAKYANEQQLGFLYELNVPYSVGIVLSLIFLDLAIYFQHRVFHKIPLLWRFHKVHHCDCGFDTSTALRFHALEILMSMYFKMILVIGIGVAPLAIVLFEVILNACALFNHSNVRIPTPWENGLRWILITPDVHRIHHSVDPQEFNSNFGFSVPYWDWIFRSYSQSPKLGHEFMVIGLADLRDPTELGFMRLLRLPFRSK